MGYSTINNCLAVEFDSFDNEETNDPFFDHVAVMKSGTGDNAVHNGTHELFVAGISELDNRIVTVRIEYDAAAKTFKVFDGNSEVVSLTNFDIETYVTLDDGRAWIGIMATSGEFNSTGPTKLSSWSADIPDAPCLEGVLQGAVLIPKDGIATISTTPSMPPLTSQLTNATASNSVEWRLEVAYTEGI